MSTLKTKVNEEEVVSFLQDNFDSNISSVGFIKGGELSQAFSFNSSSQDLIIRINNKKYSFEKDKYAYEHFKSSNIPIPKILKIDRFNDKYFYAISEKVEGVDLDNLDEEAHRELLPQLISILDSIHEIRIENTQGYGYWNGEGKANFSSWKSFILSYKNDVYSKWEKLYKDTIFEKEMVDKVCGRIEDLVEYLPEERFLVHGDYGFNNVIFDGSKITGILDWGESKYGDFLFDVAWLEFYSPNIRYKEIFKEHYEKTGIKVPNYEERLLCYLLHLGIGGLGFYAASSQEQSYKWQKEKLLLLLES